MTRKKFLTLLVSAAMAHPAAAADAPASVATAKLPPGSYRQELPGGTIRLVEPERYLVQLDTPALYPLLEQELRASQPLQLAPDQVLSEENWQQLSAAQISAAEARVQNEQLLARLQIQSRYPQARVTGQFRQLENALLVTLTAPDKQQLVQQLAQLPGVRAVYPEQLVQAFLSQSVPLIQAPAVWAMQRDGVAVKGQNIRVAVLDTGVDYTHEALGGCFGAGCKVAGGYDFVGADNDPMDVHGHGTHVASTIAGQSATITGVAPEASIYAYKVLADNGYGSSFDIIAALEKALDPDGNPLTADGAHIINMSLGNDGRDPQDPMNVAVSNASKAGALVVVAAGNSGPAAGSVGSPGIVAEALTVANTEKTDSVAFDSSRGPGLADAVLKPELAAPGSNIYAAIPNNQYQAKSGTSMAAPHVAGAAALLLQAEPQLTAQQLKQRLIQNTDPLKASFWDHGNGRLNVHKALRAPWTLSESALHLGHLNHADFASQGTRRISVQNRSGQLLELALKTSAVPTFLTATLSHATLKLAPGETQEVELSYLVHQERIPQDPPANALHQFHIELAGGGQSGQIPVLLDHYFEVRIHLASTMSSVAIYSPQWQRIANHFNLQGHSWLDLRLVDRKINMLANASSPPDALIPAETRYLPVTRENWIFRTDIDVAATPALTLSNSEIKHRLRLKAPTKHGEPFWSVPFKNSFGTWSMADGDQLIEGGMFWSVCQALCAASAPTEFYLSDVPATFGLKSQHQLLISELIPQQMIMASYRFTSPLQSQDLQIDFTGQQRVTLRKARSSPNERLAMGQLAGLGPTGPLDLQIWHQSVGLDDNELPDNRMRFEDTSKYVNAAVVSTQQWRLTDAGILQKFRCKANHCDITKLSDLELIYSSEVRELSFDNNLRYLTSPLQLGAEGLQIKPRHNIADLYYSNNIFNDLWQNDVANYTELQARQQCGTQVDTLAAFEEHLSYYTTASYFAAALTQPYDCKDHKVFISYPLAARDGQELRGEISFMPVNAGLASPYFVNLATFNRGARGDTISRIDNQFSVEVASGADPVKAFKVWLKAGAGDWQLAYHGYNAGLHQFPLPLRAGEQWLDLRLQVQMASGNELLNTMPKALRLGASAGGDNDVDSDGILNDVDTDNDNDSIADVSDAFPYNPTESLDSDQDGLGNNADPDDDNDGVPDEQDAFPLDPNESVDTDKDGIGNNADPDDDNDGVPDVSDAFPLDPKESVDTDQDGIGNNADPDDDNDGVPDVSDAFPLDPKESVDTDKDGIGNNADPDDDNDGVPDVSDAFPLDPNESVDTDKDGIGNNADPDDDNDGVADVSDAFPLDPKESVDTDKDGIGNNADPDDDNDGVPDVSDAFPLDPNESVDTDKDGIGNNADPDDDNDGVPDVSDKYPLDASRSSDPVTPPAAGNSSSGGGGGAGLGLLMVLLPVLSWRRQRQSQSQRDR